MCSQRNKLKRSPFLRYHSINISSVYILRVRIANPPTILSKFHVLFLFFKILNSLLFRFNSSFFITMAGRHFILVFSSRIDSVFNERSTLRERHPKVSQFLRIDVKNSSFPWNYFFLFFRNEGSVSSHFYGRNVSLRSDLILRFEASRPSFIFLRL